MKQTLVIAFPGCGKTTTVKAIRDRGVETAVDFDIKGSKKLLNREVIHAQTGLVYFLFKAGANFIFTHNGALDLSTLLTFKPSINVILVTPKRDLYYAWMARIQKRDGDCEFLRKMGSCFYEWLDDYWKLYSNLRTEFGPKNLHYAFLDADEWISREWLSKFD